MAQTRVAAGGGGRWTPDALRSVLQGETLLRFTVPNVIPGWDPRQHTLETLLANTCVVLNDATHPLVRAYAPVPTPAMSRAQTLDQLDVVRLGMIMQGTANAIMCRSPAAAAASPSPAPAAAESKPPAAAATASATRTKQAGPKKPAPADTGLEGLRGALRGVSVRDDEPKKPLAAPAPAPAPASSLSATMTAARRGTSGGSLASASSLGGSDGGSKDEEEDDEWDVNPPIVGGNGGGGRGGQARRRKKGGKGKKKPAQQQGKSDAGGGGGGSGDSGTAGAAGAAAAAAGAKKGSAVPATATAAAASGGGGSDDDEGEEDEDSWAAYEESDSSSEDEFLAAQLRAVAARQGRSLAKKESGPKKPRKPRIIKPALDSEHPLEFICGISHKLMADPVICMDGQSYERKIILKWIADQQARGLPVTSPVSGERIDPHVLPNISLRNLIFGYTQEKGIPMPQPPA